MSPVRLLLVEDDAILRAILEETLGDAGFELVMVDNGTSALSALENADAKFSGIVTDIKLGKGPGGWDVARRARELVHDMPIVYMSGDSKEDWASLGVPNSVMVPKPFVPAQIVTAIAALLNLA